MLHKIKKPIIAMAFVVALFILTTAAAATPHVIPISKDKWTCYDYSVDYHKKHADWGIVTIGGPFFKTNSHMVNYKILNNGETLLIHDGLNRPCCQTPNLIKTQCS